MRISLVCAAALLASPGDARAESLAAQVNRAIERGVAAARTYLGEDGAGRTHYHAAYPEGDTALVLYTLVKSGVSPDDPQVRKCLEWLRYRPMTKTYGAGVYILAMDAFKDHALDPQIRAAARWIEDHFHQESKRWNYPGEHTDLSNTQYAVLGLWAAERHGFKAKPETWGDLLSGVIEVQMPDDGFAYRTDRVTTGAMTVAGITVLELALARVRESLPRYADVRRKAKAALAKGWGYLDRRFTAEGNPVGAHALKEEWLTYFLYGVERLCAITGRDKIGGRDWYAEGARRLVATQEPKGNWGAAWETCFALLFLRRATATMMERDTKPVEGEGMAAPPAGPARPRGDVAFVRRWLLLGPLEDPNDDLLERSVFDESKAAPRALSRSGTDRWVAARSRKDEIDLGGAAPRDKTLTCAFTYLHAEADVDVVLWIGHDNGARMWLDGRLLHDHHFEEAYGPDSFAFPVRLATGVHRLLMKVHNGGGPHNLYLRVAKPDGTPPTNLVPSLSPDDPELGQLALNQPGLFPMERLFELLPRDRQIQCTFDTVEHLDRIAVDGFYGSYPSWGSGKQPSPGMEDPNPGAFGMLGIHPASVGHAMTAYWKVKVPDTSPGRAKGKPPRCRFRVSSTPAASPGKADGLLRIGVFDGALKWLASEVVGPDAAPDAKNWHWIEIDLAGYEGKEILLAIQAADGGRTSWHWEGIWIDEMEIRAGG